MRWSYARWKGRFGTGPGWTAGDAGASREGYGDGWRKAQRFRACCVCDGISAECPWTVPRRGFRFDQGKNAWTPRYHQWLRGLRLEHVCAQAVFDDYYLAITQLEERLKNINERLEEAAALEEYREPIAHLRCFRGIDTVTALALQAELLDFRRFPSPGKLASYLGITASEHSSSGKPNRGRITKTGNGHVRRLLVEAAHRYRHQPGVGVALRKRRQGQSQAVIAVADKAQRRLHRRYHRLVARGLETNKALIAVARELAGFVWGAMTLEVTT